MTWCHSGLGFHNLSRNKVIFFFMQLKQRCSSTAAAAKSTGPSVMEIFGSMLKQSIILAFPVIKKITRTYSKSQIRGKREFGGVLNGGVRQNGQRTAAVYTAGVNYSR